MPFVSARILFYNFIFFFMSSCALERKKKDFFFSFIIHEFLIRIIEKETNEYKKAFKKEKCEKKQL